MQFESDEKLKGYLKSESKRLNISIGNIYNTYFARVLLERISRINYAKNNSSKLVVKGSFSELAHLNEVIRPITDIDLVSSEYHNNPLIILYQAMYDSNCENDITFELSDLPKKTRTGIYKISLIGTFGKIKHPISIDFMELSKTLYDIDYKRVNPIFKGDTLFYVCTPTYEEHLAEKLCIVAENMKPDVLNTRVKDFYDIYKLSGGKYDFDRLTYYFQRMIEDRNKIDLSNLSIKHLNKEFILKHQNLWDSMSKKYEFTDKSINLYESVYLTKEMLKTEIDKYKIKK